MGHGPGRGMMPGEKAKDFTGTIQKLFAYLGSYRIVLGVVILFAIGSTVFNIIGPKVLSKVTTELFNGLVAKVSGTGGIDFEKIGRILLLLLGIYCISAVFNFIQGWLMTGVTQKLCYRMRKEISEKINRIPMKYFESRTVGEVLSRITNDVDTLGQSLNQSVTQLITSIATMIGVLIMMLSISPLMTLIALVILPISGGLIGFVVKHSQKYFVEQQSCLGEINGQVEETYSGHMVIRAFNREEAVEETFSRTNDRLYESAWKSQFISGLMQPIMTFVGNLGYVAVAVLGSVLAVNGTIEVGDIQAFIQYVKNFTQPITQIAQVSNMLQSAAAAAERVFEFLDEEEEEQTVEHPVSMDHLTGAVSFEHVRFGYTPDKIVIQDFSCEVKPGQMVAIVGPTGAGKTTILHTITGLLKAKAGSIMFEGHELTKTPAHKIVELGMAHVPEGRRIFSHLTVLENLKLGAYTRKDKDGVAADLRKVYDRFPRLAERKKQIAGTLSGGEQQMLAMGRALMSKPRIIVMDEPSMGLSPIFVSEIFDIIQSISSDGVTVLLVEQNAKKALSIADRGYVLETGKIVLAGEADELINDESVRRAYLGE